jgi:hypothetical protein
MIREGWPVLEGGVMPQAEPPSGWSQSPGKDMTAAGMTHIKDKCGDIRACGWIG